MPDVYAMIKEEVNRQGDPAYRLSEEIDALDEGVAELISGEVTLEAGVEKAVQVMASVVRMLTARLPADDGLSKVSPHRITALVAFSVSTARLDELASATPDEIREAVRAELRNGVAYPNALRMSLATMGDELRGAVIPYEQKLDVIDGGMAVDMHRVIAEEYVAEQGPRILMPH